MSQAQLDSVHALVRAINASDISGIAPLLCDKSFSHRYMPSTMGPEAVGSRNKTDTLAVFKGTFDNVVEHMGIEIKETVQGQDRVVILIDDNGKKKNGVPYHVEYVMFVGFVPGTDKISSVVEFQDSLYVAKEFTRWYEKSKA